MWLQYLTASIAGATAVIAFAVVVVAWRQRPEPGATWLAVAMSGTGWWAVFYGLRVAVDDPQLQLFLLRLQWIGIVVLPVAWCLFALDYTGHGRLASGRIVAAAFVLPATTLALIWTSDYHELLGHDPVTNVEAFTLVYRTTGPWFWLHVSYSLALGSIGTLLLLTIAVRNPNLYRGQAASVVLAALLPIVGTLVFLDDDVLTAAFDPTPFALTLTGVLCLGAVTRYRLLDVIPVSPRVARSRVVERMDDPVLVVDCRDRVVDCNDAARAFLGTDQFRGLSADDDVPGYEAALGNDGESPDTISVPVDDRRRWFEVRVTDVRDHRDRLTGRIVVYRDVTDRRNREQRLNVLNRVLRHNLRNELNVVQGYADRLADEHDPHAAEQIKRQAATIVELADKARTIECVLDDAEDGDDPIDLGWTIEQLLAYYRDVYPDVSFRLDGPDGTAHCPAVVEHVIDALIENAAVHNDSDDPYAEVTVTVGGDQVRVSVADNGPGIPESEQRAIETGRETQLDHGSGLGLWLVAWGTSRVGGSVTFSDNDPRGSVVVLEVPRSTPGANAADGNDRGDAGQGVIG